MCAHALIHVYSSMNSPNEILTGAAYYCAFLMATVCPSTVLMYVLLRFVSMITVMLPTPPSAAPVVPSPSPEVKRGAEEASLDADRAMAENLPARSSQIS